jgi:hypothetical protein
MDGMTRMAEDWRKCRAKYKLISNKAIHIKHHKYFKGVEQGLSYVMFIRIALGQDFSDKGCVWALQ